MESLALYIHWPFCLAKCPYCDFNSHVRERIDQARFASALRAELAWEAARLGRRRVTSIFFGGGTPSLMEPATAAALIADARRFFDAADDLEITLEANPTSVEAGRFAAYRDAGVNRISLGVQSLEPEALRRLGRQHSVEQAVAALEIARRIFSRISFDLIYARPGQALAAWRRELRRALDLVADHLSLYQLTIEPGTAFEALHRRGEIVLPRRIPPPPCTTRPPRKPPVTACCRTRSPIMPDRARRAATTCNTGVTAITPASVRARMAG
jgi:oxygen-independent coproporphyrinogen-3 oxidase